MHIELDDLSRPQVHALLREHLSNMHELSPPESVHALDLCKLKSPGITFWTAWEGPELLGCGALKELDPAHGEVKSMRTPKALRRRGAGRAILIRILEEARSRGYTRLSLETGAHEDFRPAQRLYESFGFASCGPFGEYAPDPHSVFMTLALEPASHDARIISQFTKMADAFATSPRIVDRDALDLLLRETGASASDDSLDVACGAGVVACHFASVVRSATGIDITPAMIEKARGLQAKAGLANVRWDLGDVKRLPYPDASFSIVTSRYAFHHIPQPVPVLCEMVRVCKPGSIVLVADICVSEDPRKAARFNELEKLNDETHFRALPLSEHIALFRQAGLGEPKIARYKLDYPLLRLQQALGHSPEAARATEARVRAAIREDLLGTDSRIEGDDTIFSYPIAVLTARKAR